MRPNPPPPLGGRPRNAPSRKAASEYALAEANLGRHHPLVALLRSTQTAQEQALTVATVQAASLILLLEQISVAAPLFLACGATQIALGLRIAYLASGKRDASRRLVMDGRENLPLPTVQRELRPAGRCPIPSRPGPLDRRTRTRGHPHTLQATLSAPAVPREGTTDRSRQAARDRPPAAPRRDPRARRSPHRSADHLLHLTPLRDQCRIITRRTRPRRLLPHAISSNVARAVGRRTAVVELADHPLTRMPRPQGVGEGVGEQATRAL